MAAPTDTVYGLLADATNPLAVERLFLAKGRGREKSVSIFLEKGEIHRFCRLSEVARELMDTLLPGPYTLVLPATPNNGLAAILSPQETVGVRVIDHPVILKLLRLTKRPLTATSANPSGLDPAQAPEELHPELVKRIDGVIHGGRTPGGASTVVSLVTTPPKVLREGKGMEAFRRWYERRF